MKLLIKVGLLVIGLAVGATKLLFLIKSDLLYLIPFLGCSLGLWYLLRLVFFIFSNANHLNKMANVAMNVIYLCQKKGLKKEDPGVKEFLRKFSVEPNEFQRNF